MAKELQKELDETAKTICEQIKDGKGMSELEIGMVNALANLAVARALVDYVSKFCADLSPVRDE